MTTVGDRVEQLQQTVRRGRVAVQVGREALPQFVQEGTVASPQAVREGRVGLLQDKETLHWVVRICLVVVGRVLLTPGCKVGVLEWDSLAVEGVHTLALGVVHSLAAKEVGEDAVQSFLVVLEQHEHVGVVVPVLPVSFCIHTHSKRKQ